MINQAEQAIQIKDYKLALATYSSIQDNDWLSQEEKDQIRLKIVKCRQEISFRLFLADGDAYFTEKAYLKALSVYYKALELKPDHDSLQKNITAVEEILDRKYEETVLLKINAGLNLIRNKEYEEGFIMLMKQHESGYLKGSHLFLMAQILDATPKKIKKTFDFKNSDCCIWTLRFMIEAKNLGMDSDKFNFFWKAHLNKKSKSCIG